MKRPSFFKTTGALALTAGVGFNKAFGFVPAYNWEKYDFGSGPQEKTGFTRGLFHSMNLNLWSPEAVL